MLTAIALLAFLLLTVPVAADERTFGTSSLVSHTLQASAFSAAQPGDAVFFHSNALGSRYCSLSSQCILEAPVMLPEGAQVVAVELDACDTEDLQQVAARFRRVGIREGTNATVVSLSTGFTDASGCRLISQALTSPHTINNVNSAYRMQIFFETTEGIPPTDSRAPVNANVRFQAVRIFYRLQISPAPAVATFADVPTNHPFFPFIEALVRAGITAGCDDSPPLFCPDAAVTRKQMAAFLARALGLHWPLSTGIGGDGQ